MASTYVQVTIDDLRPMFQKTNSKGVKWQEHVQGRSEIVFDFQVSPRCVVRVWTSCHTSTQRGAKCGADAIRVCAFNPVTKRGLVKAPRVYRTVNWRDNLTKRVTHVFTEVYSMKGLV